VATTSSRGHAARARRTPSPLSRAARRSGRQLESVFGGPERTRVIVLLAAVLAMSSADAATVGAAATPLRSALKIDNTDIGLLVTASSLVAAFASVPFGILADRVRRTRCLAISVAFWGIAMLWSATAPNFGRLLLSRLFLGVVTAAAGPIVASLVGDYFPSGERGRVYSYILTGELIGAGIGFGITGDIAALDWRAAFVILALPTFFLARFLFRLPEPARGGVAPLPHRGGHPVAPPAGASPSPVGEPAGEQGLDGQRRGRPARGRGGDADRPGDPTRPTAGVNPPGWQGRGGGFDAGSYEEWAARQGLTDAPPPPPPPWEEGSPATFGEDPTAAFVAPGGAGGAGGSDGNDLETDAQRVAREKNIAPDADRVLRANPQRMPIWTVGRYLLSIRTNTVLIVASACAYFYLAGVETFGVEFTSEQYRVPDAVANLLILLVGVGAVFGVLVGGGLSDGLLRRRVLNSRILVAGVAAVVTTLLFVPALLTRSTLTALPYLTLAAFALTAQNPPIDAARLDIVPPLLWGRAEGIRTLLRTLAQSLAPVLFGALSDLLGGDRSGLQWTFAIMLVPLMANGVILLLATKTYPRDVATAAAARPAPSPR